MMLGCVHDWVRLGAQITHSVLHTFQNALVSIHQVKKFVVEAKFFAYSPLMAHCALMRAIAYFCPSRTFIGFSAELIS